MKIAIVGTGISGLTVAHLLHRRHQVTLFEAAEYVGGHTHTVRVDTPNETHHVDTGFIVFNDRNYPNFERLLRTLGVAWQPSEMSFSVSDDAGTFEYASRSPNALFANRRHLATPGFHRMVADLHRFHRAARRLLDGGDEHVSLRDWLEEQHFSRGFVDRLIVPQAAAVWSADPRSLWSFPARFLAEFFANHGMLGFRGRPHWRAISGGSARYVAALSAPFAHRIRLRAPVSAIERAQDDVLVTVGGAAPMRFDHVVLATHSDQALTLLRDPTAREHEILSSIPYQVNEAVLHTDVRLLPRRRRAWASWNYHLLEEPPGRATVTYHMNRLQSLSAEREFCVTLNHTARIDPERVIKRIQYAHPVYTPAGIRAQSRVGQISGTRRTHFCGAYWGWGFHEDGVNSALRVAAELGAEP
ncbi:MAG TPA: FAD-dependent oxidoreductase [Solirubrobacteraceae bacterium]|nr:FAD-dependent oxidoreductase [Solirubrobacteraceae bacterium]